MFVPSAAGINVSDSVRLRGRLTVIPMRGWHRGMRWPDTGLKWIPTSPMIQSYDAAVGYAMTGLGQQNNDWSHTFSMQYPFRGLSYKGKTPEEIIAALNAYDIPGVKFLKVQAVDRAGKVITGVYVDVADWEKWNPTELSFYMQKQAALWNRMNPFAMLTASEQRTFKIHVGSNAWYDELVRAGGRIDVPMFLRNWDARAAVYREQSKRYWLYPWNDGSVVAATPAAASRSR